MQLKCMIFKAAIVSCAAIFGTVATAQTWYQWSSNGHWYALVDRGTSISWDFARVDATTLTAPNGASGFLATITSAAENAFAFSLLSPSDYYSDQFGSHIGPWLGGFQDRNAPDYSEPGGGWRWITGETFGPYTNWDINEPSNSGGTEDVLHFFGNSSSSFSDWNHWNDITAQHPTVLIDSYVVEAVPEPATLVPLVLGLAGLLRARRSSRAGD